MSRTEDALRELENSIPEYVKKLGKAQRENESFTLVDHYKSDTFLTCQICTKEEINDIYVVVNNKNERLVVGNVCIKRLWDSAYVNWFVDYTRRKKRIGKNKVVIDTVDKIVRNYFQDSLPIYISKIGIQRLVTMLDRMCEGMNYTTKQFSLLTFYAQKIEQEVTAH